MRKFGPTAMPIVAALLMSACASEPVVPPKAPPGAPVPVASSAATADGASLAR